MPLDHAQPKRRSNKQVPGTAYVPKDMLAPAPSRAASYLRPLLLCPEQRPGGPAPSQGGARPFSQSHRTGESSGGPLVSPDANLGKECNADTCALHLPHALHASREQATRNLPTSMRSPQNKPAAWPYNTHHSKVPRSRSQVLPHQTHHSGPMAFRAKVHALTMIPPLSPSG